MEKYTILTEEWAEVLNIQCTEKICGLLQVGVEQNEGESGKRVTFLREQDRILWEQVGARLKNVSHAGI